MGLLALGAVEQLVEAGGLRLLLLDQGVEAAVFHAELAGLAGARVDLERATAAGAGHGDEVPGHDREFAGTWSRRNGSQGILPLSSAQRAARCHGPTRANIRPTTDSVALDDTQEAVPGTAASRPRPLPPIPDQMSGDASAREHDPEEAAVVRRAQDGDGDAFRVLVERYQDHVFRLAMRILKCDRSQAEDLCQEIFMRAWRGLPRFDLGVRFPVWLHTIAMNTTITEYRSRRTIKRGRHREVSIDAPLAGTDDLYLQPPSREVDPAARADQSEFAAAAREAMQRLPDEFRDAVVLRDQQGLGYEEIAEVLGIPKGTVRSRIHRGRVLLQEMLEGFDR